MTYRDISCYVPINPVDENKVDNLVKSMLENGWQGMPILTYGEALLTGSHRFAALKKIARMVDSLDLDDAPILDADVVEDVTEIVNENLRKYEEENGEAYDFEYSGIDYSDIGWLLKDSWVEDYKDEIREW